MEKKKRTQTPRLERQQKTKTKAAENQVVKAQDESWEAHTSIIREYFERSKSYSQVCREVAFVLETRARESGVEIAAVTHRTKSLESFLEKISRKSYRNPMNEITDIAGARIVVLYRKDIGAISNIVESEFEIIEKIDKVADHKSDSFGYGALHFIVRIGPESLGARYDGLRKLLCEVQVRTVMQDAWAIIQHHLAYKRESEIPSPLQRKLYGLAALLDIADDQYQSICDARDQYILGIRELQKHPDAFLCTPLNPDSLVEYLRWKFPGQPLEPYEGFTDRIISGINSNMFSTLRELDDALDRTEMDRQRARATAVSPDNVPATTELIWALRCADPEFRIGEQPLSGTDSVLRMLREGLNFPDVSPE